MGESVTARIRDAILAGELVPNQRLIQVDLALELDVPRARVRDALAELTKEGLVEWIPNKGVRVRSVPLEEAIEISELRMVIESYLAARAAERIDDRTVEEMRVIGRLMEETVAAGDLQGYARANQRFHARILEISGQHTAYAVIRNLRGQNVRHQFRLAQQPGRANVSLPEHLEIVDAVCARDPEAASAAMWRHMKSVVDALRAVGAAPVRRANAWHE